MRLGFLSVTTILTSALCLVGCGTTNSGFGDGGNDVDGSTNDGNPFNFGDASTKDGGCVNLECQQTCSTTQISGYVYDPKGTVPLYNVFVYVPNAALDPITDGPVCTACQAPASGNPVVSATTDETGHFVIPNAPDGDNIPLVLQLGKWRRHVTLPHVQACTDNRYNTKADPKDSSVESLLRMPKKQHEGSPDDNIPLIAVTTGECDYGECFLLNTVGIDVSEFNTGGRVQIYDGQYGETSYPHSYGDALANLWNSPSNINKYDIIFASCECDDYDRGNGYANIHSYLNNGGRFFGTHYMYNFFAGTNQCPGSFNATCKGPADFNSVAQWDGGNYDNDSPPYYVDMSFPKGQSMAKWLVNVGTSSTLGRIDNLYELRHDVDEINAPKATRWLYSGSQNSTPYKTLYMSFNTPVNNQPDQQCGRAVFSDVHVAGTSSGFCASQDPNYLPNLNALEFLFFDLSSCVQNDTQPPIPPPH
jgi:hypothetical protein